MRENSRFGVFLNAARVVGVEADAHKSGVAQHHLETGPFWPVYPGHQNSPRRSERQHVFDSAHNLLLDDAAATHKDNIQFGPLSPLEAFGWAATTWPWNRVVGHALLQGFIGDIQLLLIQLWVTLHQSEPLTCAKRPVKKGLYEFIGPSSCWCCHFPIIPCCTLIINIPEFCYLKQQQHHGAQL